MTSATRLCRFQDNTITDLEETVLEGSVELSDNARRFVAQDHGKRGIQNASTQPSIVMVMEVTTTDAGGSNVDLYLVFSRS